MTELGCCEMVVEQDHGRVWSCDYRTREGQLIHNRIYADNGKQGRGVAPVVKFIFTLHRPRVG